MTGIIFFFRYAWREKKYYVGGTFANSTANLPFGEINVLKGNAVPEKHGQYDFR